MDKNIVAKRAKVTPRYLDYLLSGERNASPRMALRLESVTGIPKSVWVFGTPAERQKAWENQE